jgi:hypothetical protein
MKGIYALKPLYLLLVSTEWLCGDLLSCRLDHYTRWPQNDCYKRDLELDIIRIANVKHPLVIGKFGFRRMLYVMKNQHCSTVLTFHHVGYVARLGLHHVMAPWSKRPNESSLDSCTVRLTLRKSLR